MNFQFNVVDHFTHHRVQHRMSNFREKGCVWAHSCGIRTALTLDCGGRTMMLLAYIKAAQEAA